MYKLQPHNGERLAKTKLMCPGSDSVAPWFTATPKKKQKTKTITTLSIHLCWLNDVRCTPDDQQSPSPTFWI
ncbi:hypothetical protein BABINDRAFT_162622, partial [Babjeviella inositovora NRRL Y-12698]